MLASVSSSALLAPFLLKQREQNQILSPAVPALQYIFLNIYLFTYFVCSMS